MSTSASSSHTATTQPGAGVNAAASAQAPKQDTILVKGQAGDSVNVQSQLATSHVAGDITSKSNIGQVVNDLGSAHSASNSWLDSETAKVADWGKGEIARILAKTKGMEEQLVAGAREKQKALDAKHSGELAKLVQEMDLRKAAELKELEDGLQRQIQAALTTSKDEINRIESEMNKRKMDLLKQSQLRNAKEIDQLSNLVVETKLVPSQTKTVIETNTETGNIVAVATGGSIATGSAQADTHSSARIAAIPNAGELRQAAEVTTGDMIQDATGRKVGEGAIVNTMTNVAEQQQQRPQQGAGRDVTVQARPMENERLTEQQRPIALGHERNITPVQPPVQETNPSGLLSKEQLHERERRLSSDKGVHHAGAAAAAPLAHDRDLHARDQATITAPAHAMSNDAGKQNKHAVVDPAFASGADRPVGLAGRTGAGVTSSGIGTTRPVGAGNLDAVGTTGAAPGTNVSNAVPPIVGAAAPVGHTGRAPGAGVDQSQIKHTPAGHVDDVHGKTLPAVNNPDDRDIGLHNKGVDSAAAAGDVHTKHHHTGMMEKVKHALGMEPKSSDATKRV